MGGDQQRVGRSRPGLGSLRDLESPGVHREPVPGRRRRSAAAGSGRHPTPVTRSASAVLAHVLGGPSARGPATGAGGGSRSGAGAAGRPTSRPGGRSAGDEGKAGRISSSPPSRSSFSAPERLLVPVVHTRHARHAEQHGERVPEVPLVVQGRRQPGHVVVADERLREHPPSRNSLCRPSAWSSSKKFRSLSEDQIAFHSSYCVIESSPAFLGVSGVIAVDHLADKPRGREGLAHGGQHLGPEARRHRVGGVQPPAARAPAEPVAHHLDDVAEDRGLVVVELDQLAVALEDAELAVRPVA